MVSARTSTDAVAKSGTTLDRVPPEMTPTFTEIPRSRFRIASTASTCSASSRMALTPLRGSTPGVRRQAVNGQLVLADALARRLERAAGQRGLQHQHRLALPGFRFDQRAGRIAARLLVGRPQHRDARVGGGARSTSARVASMPSAMPAFMSRTPGPCNRPASSRKGIRPNCPMGHTVSKWPMTSTCRRAGTEAGQQMIAGCGLGHRRDRRPDRAKPIGEHRAAAVHGRLVVGGRFDSDERVDEVEQPVLTIPTVFKQARCHASAPIILGMRVLVGVLLFAMASTAAAQTPQPFPTPSPPPPRNRPRQRRRRRKSRAERRRPRLQA